MLPAEQMKTMKQLSLAETGFLPKAGKQTRKAAFLAEMDSVVPWSRLEGFDAFEDVMPDESTILRFRYLLEKHDLAVAIFAEVGAFLSEKGLSMKRGTLVDATLITAPSSTKNEDKKR